MSLTPDKLDEIVKEWAMKQDSMMDAECIAIAYWPGSPGAKCSDQCSASIGYLRMKGLDEDGD